MLKVTPNNFFYYILRLHKFTNTITEFKPCVYRADFMIIEEEVSSYTYANWVFLCQHSRSNHIELKLYAAITLVVSTFVLLAPSMHWRCTEDKAKCTSVKLHAYIYKDIVQEGVVVLTFEIGGD